MDELKSAGSNKKAWWACWWFRPAETVRKNPQTAWKYCPKSWCPPKKCWMKWLSRRTGILWQMSSIRPGVKDGRVPGYQFCSVLNKCIRPLPVRDTKIIHWAWVDNPGWESPVLHYSLKVRHIIQSLWILHFSNFSYRRFISPTNRSRNLLHHRADKWTKIRTLIFWLAAYIHCMKRPERLSWRSVVSEKQTVTRWS